MITTPLIGLRALARNLRRRIGGVDIAELRRLADEGLIPSVRLRSDRANGTHVYGFDAEAVARALLQLARARKLPGDTGGEGGER